MASRQNITGRNDGFGQGPLSRVYGKARKLAMGARAAGAAPGTPLEKVKAAGRNRGGMRGMIGGAKKLAAGLESSPVNPLAGGVPPVAGGIGAKLAAGIQARPAPAPPDITLNQMPGLPAPAASMAQPTPMVSAQPTTSVETMGGPAPAAVPVPSGRSIRSRGLHRSRRPPEDRG